MGPDDDVTPIKGSEVQFKDPFTGDWEEIGYIAVAAEVSEYQNIINEHVKQLAMLTATPQPPPTPAAARAKKLRELIPDINTGVRYPCSCAEVDDGEDTPSVWYVIQHLNDAHNPKGFGISGPPEDPWSRERIADWLESLDLNLNITPNKES